MTTTGEEEIISAMEEDDGRWSRCSEAERRWQQAVLGERAGRADTKRSNGGSMNERLTVFILNGVMEGKELTCTQWRMNAQWRRFENGGSLKTAQCNNGEDGVMMR